MLFLNKVKEKYKHLENIFEIGAHRGHDIKYIVEAFPESNIYAFEADPFNYEICVENCRHFNNVKIYNLAVYDSKTKMTFNRFCNIEAIPDSETFKGSNLQSTGCGSLHKPGVGLKDIYKIKDVVEEIEVETITLESFCSENNINSVDAIFMDVQGAEMNVIKGCHSMIESVKALILEWSTKYTLYENETDFIWIKSHLESNNLNEVARQYQLQGINGDSLFLR